MADGGGDGWFGLPADGVLVWTGGLVVTEISLLEPWCDGSAGSARGIAPLGDPAGRLALLGSVAVVDGCGVDGRAVGAATVPWPGPVARGRAVGTLPSAGWPATVGWPGREARMDGVCVWWLAEPGWSAEPVWLAELGWPAAGDGLAGWLAPLAWPGTPA